jgi:hypothetical protein
MALAAVDAIAKITERKGGLRDPGPVTLLIRITEGSYITPVKEKARMVLNNMRTPKAQQSQSNR